MDLSHLRRQSAEWEAYSGLNDRGEHSYGSPTTVAARIVPKLRDLIGRNGEVVTTTSCYYLAAEPALGDLLDGHEVIAVEYQVDITGATVGYIAFVR